jgi:hypothetical protein
MRSLLELGRLESLETAAEAFMACIQSRNFFEPEAFTVWCRNILVDHPAKKALILTPGTIIDGDLSLDDVSGDPIANSIGTVLALGDLTINGRILNISGESGDFLLVGGDLRTDVLIKGASNIVALGSVTAAKAIFCDFCGGALVTGGDLNAPLIVSNDHEVTVGGSLTGLMVSSELGNMRETLVTGVFADPDDPDDEWPDGELIREHLEAGLPLLRANPT